ncbi:hypothetical protein BATDEDRAFT_25848 [Batrachochytrium dendrobatidis JAM81]|uniref:HAD phosphatase, family IIIA n=2 Tax=Batrachochytrium dendrobatidis TaxID=109871 RepID=F4P5T7_BATDJ|nr:phosphatidylglycerophosphatase [Batrachochytrium dendrobatidis JAM81]EGF79481.1 hypothetical protein BATDEDRAFT_25848 [Batrachochytrium dendrobatidis JAM81]KAJ8322815.1 hypothetical protein O5D80_008345 [Batrachochytrium dendrobatidis]KAK5665868.1 hypothetical protein QVD99_007494 [Batrachochytrium dendrobatidis]OAJ42806.1 HAD phosphatase, family IIIA [Batrachochytrium dendrobatidis JEL423]|eukprot:XP_006679898.1 hypothetical protein BATDEDRAFT_25848 [Batrachochytrium dendrobatidis JAM81]
MVQSINFAGLRGVFSLLRRPSMAMPHLVVDDINSIPFSSLKQAGFKAIAFDKDNTLAAPYVNQIHPPLQDSWSDCLYTFGSVNVAIVSNSAGSSDDKDYVEASKVEQAFGVRVLRHAEKKPAGGQELVAHFRCQPHEIIFVGDRISTDILYATRMGAYAILINRIVTEKNDNWMAKHIRKLERLLLNTLEKGGYKPNPHILVEQQNG